ncbi:MAG TPA: endonuclease III [Gemmatimonadaceae bacterium]|nr:endonuclease III [Gemmatimonadaceae bacterium]
MAGKKGARGRASGTAPRTTTARKRPARKAARAAKRLKGTRPKPGPWSPDPDRIYDELARAYPDAHCALDHRNAFELIVATILSAQCTDKRVNMVTPVLFAKYPDARALAAAKQEEVEEIIRSTGFFRNKAQNIIAMAGALVDAHGGEVPCDMNALTALPGVGRKTANVVLGNAFGRNEGIVVDTHVSRLSQRLGLVRENDPVKIESALVPLFARDRWTMLSHLLIEHGRQVCDARKPRCGDCMLVALCPSAAP